MCVFVVAVVQFCTTTHQTHENSSSADHGLKVVGRRFRDLVRPDGGHNLRLLERAGVVVVDHLEDLARRGQELGAELLVGGGRRALAALALLRHLLQALREAAVDRRLPCAQINQ